MRSLLHKDWFLIVLAVVVWITAATLLLPLTYFAFWIATAATVPPNPNSRVEPVVQQQELLLNDRNGSINWTDCLGVATCIVRCMWTRRCAE